MVICSCFLIKYFRNNLGSWGDVSVRYSMHATHGDLGFYFQQLYKSLAWWHSWVASFLGRVTDKRIPEAVCPDSLVESMSSRFGEKPCLFWYSPVPSMCICTYLCGHHTHKYKCRYAWAHVCLKHRDIKYYFKLATLIMQIVLMYSQMTSRFINILK